LGRLHTFQRIAKLISADGLSMGLVEMIFCFPGSTIATIAACCGGWFGVTAWVG
jgi:hypothetical protein